VENYFQILVDTLIGSWLPAWKLKQANKQVLHPKFYFFDTGIYNTLRPMGPLDNPEMTEGVALESLFLQNLRAINDNLELGYKLYYYRTATGMEVDFVVYGKKGMYAFEVKRSDKLSTSSLKGLRFFKTEYPLTKCFFVYGGKKRFWRDGIEIVPISEALISLPKILG